MCPSFFWAIGCPIGSEVQSDLSFELKEERYGYFISGIPGKRVG